MTDTHALDTQRTVHLTRRFDAGPEAVFRAWTDPAEVAEWYGPDGWHAPIDRIRIDGEIGGRWEVTMVRRSDGSEFPIGYEILELRAPSLIVLRYTDPSGAGQESTLVRVELAPDGDGTLMTLTDGPMPAEGRDHAAGGYVQAFEKLAARLGGRASGS
jgi:uncharacterized protein YndB with AHSA1/START domain